MFNKVFDRLFTKFEKSDPDKVTVFMHHHPFIVCGVMAMLAVVNNIFVLWPISIIQLLFIPTVIYTAVKHGVGICTGCINAKVGSESEAEKRAWHLQMFHWLNTLKHSTIIIAAGIYIVGSAFITAIVGVYIGTIFSVFMWVIAAWLGWSVIMHSRLMPWCKFCKDDNDDEEYDRVPDPENYGSRY